MKSYRKTSIVAGSLIILGIVAGIFSVAPSVEGIDYLSKAFESKNQILMASVFQFLLVPIYIGFALLLYPILKNYNTSLALGFVSFRVIASVFQIVGVILLPLFILISEAYLQSQTSNTSSLEISGELLKSARDLANHLGVMLATGLGNLLLYFVFLKTKLIPSWLSLWGLIGNVLAMLTSFFILFEWFDVISTAFIVMTVPLVIQEIVLSVFLLTKGFQFKSNHLRK